MSAFKYQWNQTIDVGTAGLLSKQWTSIRHILSLLVTANACVHVTAYVAVRRSLSTTYTAVVLGLLLRQYVSYQFGVWAVYRHTRLRPRTVQKQSLVILVYHTIHISWWLCCMLKNIRAGYIIYVVAFSFSMRAFLAHWGRLTPICVGNKTSLVQIMACRLVGAKSLSETMLEYC